MQIFGPAIQVTEPILTDKYHLRKLMIKNELVSSKEMCFKQYGTLLGIPKMSYWESLERMLTF